MRFCAVWVFNTCLYLPWCLSTCLCILCASVLLHPCLHTCLFVCRLKSARGIKQQLVISVLGGGVLPEGPWLWCWIRLPAHTSQKNHAVLTSSDSLTQTSQTWLHLTLISPSRKFEDAAAEGFFMQRVQFPWQYYEALQLWPILHSITHHFKDNKGCIKVFGHLHHFF